MDVAVAILVILGLIFGIAIYFLPIIIALGKRKQNSVAILVLNLLAGWTFFGWVIALVWALTADKPKA